MSDLDWPGQLKVTTGGPSAADLDVIPVEDEGIVSMGVKGSQIVVDGGIERVLEQMNQPWARWQGKKDRGRLV